MLHGGDAGGERRMYAAVCLDDRNGILFNMRRQSMDRRQREDLRELLAGEILHLSPYSYPIFAELPGFQLAAADDFAENRRQTDWCFFESGKINLYIRQIEKLVIYRWNRRYPADVFFEDDLSAFSLREIREFPGSSHEKISRMIYERQKK